MPWALLLPVATTALFLLWWTHRDERGSNAPPFTPLVEDSWSVEGWSAAAELGAGRGRLSVRLWPLHSDPELQAFDSAALARRLALPPGEPWLAELTWTRAVPRAARGPAPAELLQAAGLTVLDGSGVALVPLEPASAPARNAAPSDPLAVLLAPPREGLGPDQSLSVLLWGCAPGGPETAETPGAARLAGLRWSGGQALAPLQLEPATHDLDALPRDLARLSADHREDAAVSGVR